MLICTYLLLKILHLRFSFKLNFHFQYLNVRIHCPLDVSLSKGLVLSFLFVSSIIVVMYHLSTPLRRCFFSLLSFSATRLREYIPCCMCRTAFLKNDSMAEKRREEEAFALASIAHYCFVETNLNCGV